MLRRAVGAAAVLGPGARLWGEAAEAGPTLIVRGRNPLNAETPIEVFDRWATPNDLFFVRSHFGAPAIGLHPWKLEVGGTVDRTLSLSLDDLAKYEQVTRPSVLQCAGNGRAFFRPRIPGVGWERGAVGQAEWRGVRLADVLERAGIQPGSAHLHMLGADNPPSPKTPAFLRSIPLDRALDPSTLIATEMNGRPLPPLHGGPMRLIVPTWSGNHWLKWLRVLTVSTTEAPGFYMQTGYRIPKRPAPPGAELKPDDLVPVTTMNVKSLIASPGPGQVLERGRHEIRGVAWTGTGRVTRVEVDTGDGWQEAALDGSGVEGAWSLWKLTWSAERPGAYRIRARAHDSNGTVQPEITPWNRSGYHWNGIETVACEVR